MSKANKKAEMAIGVVIAVAIGLLILIVLAVVLFGGGKKWETSTACINAGGICKVPASDKCAANEDQITSVTCPGNQICCKVKILTDIFGDDTETQIPSPGVIPPGVDPSTTV